VTGLKNVLLATDLSRFSRPAGAYARELCREFGATLHLLNVIQDQAHNVAEYVEHLAESALHAEQRHKHQAEQALVNLWASLFPSGRKDHPVTYATKLGDPQTLIPEYAREHRIDLIVTGTQGRSGFRRLLHGSVAEHLVRIAPCPVLTIHGNAASTD